MIVWHGLLNIAVSVIVAQVLQLGEKRLKQVEIDANIARVERMDELSAALMEADTNYDGDFMWSR